MSFTRIKPDGIFAVWGKKAYASLNKDQQQSSFYIKEQEKLEGLVVAVKPSQTYGYIFEIKPDENTIVVVTGKTQLLNQLGFKYIKTDDPEWNDALKATAGWTKTDDVIQEGELVQINFSGLEKAGNGKEMYVFDVLVDRD